MNQQVVPGSLTRPEIDRVLSKGIKVGDELPLDTKTSGVVIAFGEQYINRGGLRHKYAGTYIDFQKLLVIRSDNGEREFIYRNSNTSNVWIRIGDLPETPFWEGDEVCFSQENSWFSPSWVLNRVVYINGEATNYVFDGIRSDGRPTTINYSVKLDPPLTLMKRGNLWKFAHNEPLEFANMEAEAAFHKSLGMSQKLTYPSNTGLMGDMMFDMGSAVRSIQNGTADEMLIKDKKHLFFVLIKYDNEEFGNRMRQHTLVKFGLTETESATTKQI